MGYECDSIVTITRSAILVLLQTQWQAEYIYPDLRENRLHDKTLRVQSSHFKLRIQDLRSFYFGFVVHLCVNGETNPVLKTFRIRHRSGTISFSINIVLVLSAETEG